MGITWAAVNYMLEELTSVKVAAEKFGLSRQAIHEYCKRHKIAIPATCYAQGEREKRGEIRRQWAEGERSHMGKLATTEQAEHLLRTTTLTFKEIGAKVGISRNAVSGIKKRMREREDA